MDKVYYTFEGRKVASFQELAYCVSGNSTVFNKSFLLNYIRNSRSEEQLLFVLSGPEPDAFSQDPIARHCFYPAPISAEHAPAAITI